MTREDIKTIIDIVHKTIYGFFDVCDEEETSMTDKDKLLLKINKAICTNIRALEQELCEDCISRQAVIIALGEWIVSGEYQYTNATDYLVKRIKALPPVTPQPKTDVLDKIIAEIVSDKKKWWYGVDNDCFMKLSDVLKIINKYKVKSEDK